ncbi:MAG: fibronectin type III domain-containing protein [Armatimonadetes bacterium]|nr:fibronectin type III domain-containing protein [Armatimonadota bacterium]
MGYRGLLLSCLLCLALWTLSAGVVGSSPLVNPSFEDGPVGWFAYSYVPVFPESGSAQWPVVGGLNSPFTIIPEPGIPDGVKCCGIQSEQGGSGNGGVCQTFPWAQGSARITIDAMSYTQFGGFPYGESCLVRAGWAPGATTNRDDVSLSGSGWIMSTGSGWESLSLDIPDVIPGPGQYSLFIESYQPANTDSVMVTLWDNITWTQTMTGTQPVVTIQGDPMYPDTSVKIEWTTNYPSTSRVDYGFTQGYGESVEDTDPKIDHSIVIYGLSPSSTYHAKVTSTAPECTDWVSGDVEFKTPIQITEVASTFGAPDVVVTWKTDIPTTSQVEYGPDTGYGFTTVEDTNPVTNHQVTVTGLDEASQFHYRVWSRAPLCTPKYSVDGIFETLPAIRDTFTNASFEESHGGQTPSLYPWKQYTTPIPGPVSGTWVYHPIDGILGPFPMGGAQSWFTVQAFDGSYFLGAAAQDYFKSGGVFQRVRFAPYATCALCARFVTIQSSEGQPGETLFRLGIDPDGGADPSSESVQWWSGVSPTNDNKWQPGGVMAEAGADGVVTLFIDIAQSSNLMLHVNAVDDASFGPPVPMKIGEVKRAVQCVGVQLNDVIVTYVNDDPYIYASRSYVKVYVQEADRSAGIAVLFDPSQAPIVGDKLIIKGTLMFPDAEAMLLAHSSILVVHLPDLPAPVALNNRAVGGQAYNQPTLSGPGACNVGLRMRLFGRITWPDYGSSGDVYIDDGSKLPAGEPGAKGIRARLTYNGVTFYKGDYIAVTGVLGIERFTGPTPYSAYVLLSSSGDDWDVQ